MDPKYNSVENMCNQLGITPEEIKTFGLTHLYAEILEREQCLDKYREITRANQKRLIKAINSFGTNLSQIFQSAKVLEDHRPVFEGIRNGLLLSNLQEGKHH